MSVKIFLMSCIQSVILSKNCLKTVLLFSEKTVCSKAQVVLFDSEYLRRQVDIDP